MVQTRALQLKKQEETAMIKRKQTSINAIFVKKDHLSFDDEVICVDPGKKEEKRLVGRLRKYSNSNSISELHDFSDSLEFDKWYSKKYINLCIESTGKI